MVQDLPQVRRHFRGGVPTMFVSMKPLSESSWPRPGGTTDSWKRQRLTPPRSRVRRDRPSGQDKTHLKQSRTRTHRPDSGRPGCTGREHQLGVRQRNPGSSILRRPGVHQGVSYRGACPKRGREAARNRSEVEPNSIQVKESLRGRRAPIQEGWGRGVSVRRQSNRDRKTLSTRMEWLTSVPISGCRTPADVQSAAGTVILGGRRPATRTGNTRHPA
jgi:hypothetical protein